MRKDSKDAQRIIHAYRKVQGELGDPDYRDDHAILSVRMWLEVLAEEFATAGKIVIPEIGTLICERVSSKRHLYAFKPSNNMRKRIQEQSMSKEDQDNQGMTKLGVYTGEPGEDKTASPRGRCRKCGKALVYQHGQYVCPEHGTEGSER